MVIEMAEDGQAGERNVMRMMDPVKPSAQEVRDHEMTHLPFRSWCRECVHGRGVEAPHRARIGERGGLAHIHVDFMFMGPADVGGETVPVLVMREESTRMTLASAIPRKTTGEFVLKRALAFLGEIGLMHGDVVVRSDQESAMASLVEDIGRRRAGLGGGRWIMENSPVGSSASNGVIERAIQGVQAQVRVMKLALEKKWRAQISHKHSVIPWVIEYAAYLLNRCEVGHDGRTAYERLKGRRARVVGIEFGELVHWRVKHVGGPLGKLDSVWNDGIFLGARGKSGELIVGDRRGVFKTRTVRRKPLEERWADGAAGLVRGVPWRTSDDDPAMDGEKLEVTVMGPGEKESIVKDTSKPVPRNVYISKRDLELHGYSSGCPGCKSILKGGTRQAHSVHCRARMEDLLKGTEKHHRAQQRINEYVEEEMIASEAMKKRKVEMSKGQGTDQQDQERREAGAAAGSGASGSAGAGGAAAGAAGAGGEEDAGTGGAGAESSSSSGSSSSSSSSDDEDLPEAPADEKVPRQREDNEAHEMHDGHAKKAKLQDQGQDARSSAQEAKRVREEQAESWVELAERIKARRREKESMELGMIDGHREDEMWDIFDSKTGEVLDPELVEAARSEEMRFMNDLGMFADATVEECISHTGKKPVDTKWVDVNKGSKQDPQVRSRLVARDFKPKGEPARGDLFAAMPPLEAKKMLFSIASSHPGVWHEGRLHRPKLMFIDVKKAHLNGVVREGEFAYVQLPQDPPGRCRRLTRWLYGMRPAASAWEDDFSKKLAGCGLNAGRSSPVVFADPRGETRCVVHGDDFTFLGYEEQLRSIEEEMRLHYSLTVRGVLGPDPGDTKEITILGRRLLWAQGGISYEADPEHARRVIADMGLGVSSNGLDKPCVRETAADVEQGAEELDAAEATMFRSIAARVNYLALDRPDLQFAAKEVCRLMSRPTRGCWARLKRIARYLVQHPRLVIRFADVGALPSEVRVFSDSDWAGCLRTRRSTSGGCVVLNGAVVRSWSSTQATIALSSGEAELTALVKAAAEGIGVQALARDLGLELPLVISVDSSAAVGMAERTGVGRVKHLNVKDLWVQEKVRNKEIYIERVPGDTNPGDVGTKPLSIGEMRDKLEIIGASVVARAPRWADLEDD